MQPDRTVRRGPLPEEPLPEEQWDDRTRAALAALLPAAERRNPRGAGHALARHLGAYLDERQLMDLVSTVGAYVLLTMARNASGVEPEHER